MLRPPPAVRTERCTSEGFAVSREEVSAKASRKKETKGNSEIDSYLPATGGDHRHRERTHSESPVAGGPGFHLGGRAYFSGPAEVGCSTGGSSLQPLALLLLLLTLLAILVDSAMLVSWPLRRHVQWRRRLAESIRKKKPVSVRWPRIQSGKAMLIRVFDQCVSDDIGRNSRLYDGFPLSSPEGERAGNVIYSGSIERAAALRTFDN